MPVTHPSRQCGATYGPWIAKSPADGHTWRCAREPHDEQESLHIARDGFSW
ncbi:MAG: hypothetical protein ACRDQ9_10310 [Pseudonocardiaceae bacterium]